LQTIEPWFVQEMSGRASAAPHWDDANEVVKTLESKSDDVSDGNDGNEPWFVQEMSGRASAAPCTMLVVGL
jgi:hypothetical protein